MVFTLHLTLYRKSLRPDFPRIGGSWCTVPVRSGYGLRL